MGLRYARAMASRNASPPTSRPKATRGSAKAAKKAVAAPRKAAKKAPAKAVRKPAARTAAAPAERDAAPRIDSNAPAPVRSAAQRETRFNLLLHAACLKAGTAAAVTSISTKLPLLGRLAPVLLASISEAASVPAIQKQLVRDVLELYALDLSDDEERGVILLSTGGKLGVQMLSEQMAQKLLAQFGPGYLRLVTSRMLPLASIATDIAATIALTYTVGRRAQVLCKLPGSGARNLGELLGGLGRIDQRRLFAWSGEALRLALRPFRSVLLSLR